MIQGVCNISWGRFCSTEAAMVLVISSFCRYMLSIYEYETYNIFGQCFIALNLANHVVSKARSSMISLFINHDQYCLATLYSGYSPPKNFFMLFFCLLFIQNLFNLSDGSWWFQKGPEGPLWLIQLCQSLALGTSWLAKFKTINQTPNVSYLIYS